MQLKELCNKMDEEGFTPLSESDLDPMNGRLIYNLTNIIDECNLAIREWKECDFKKLSTTASKEGYYFYFRYKSINCSLDLNWHYWYSEYPQTPIWLFIFDEKWKKSEKIYNFLNNYDSKNSFNDDNCSAYGITLNPGMDKQQLVDHVTSKIKKVLDYLHKNYRQ